MNEANRDHPRRQLASWRTFLILASAVLLVSILVPEATRFLRSYGVDQAVTRLGGSVHWNWGIHENLLRHLSLTRITDVHFSDPELRRDDWKSLGDLPHPFGLQISGKTFTDDDLPLLVVLDRLEYLVLSYTEVTEEAIIQFRTQRPDVAVMIGYPGDEDFREYGTTAAQ